MATTKSQRAGEAFKRLIETDDATREACERIGVRLRLLAPLFRQAGDDARADLCAMQLDYIPFNYDGMLKLARMADVHDPGSKTAGYIIDAVIEWVDGELREMEREEYRQRIRESLGDDPDGGVPESERSEASFREIQAVNATPAVGTIRNRMSKARGSSNPPPVATTSEVGTAAMFNYRQLRAWLQTEWDGMFLPESPEEFWREHAKCLARNSV